MKRYLYSPYELAIIFQYHGINIVRMTEILDNIYRYDNAFVQCEYRRNQKKLMFDVMDKMNYLNNQEQFDLEKDDVDKDLSDFGLVNSNGNCDSEEAIDHLIFKELRIRILYINKKGYAKMKLRTLLSELGYKRRSPVVINYIFDCLLFYHIEVFLKDNTPCEIDKIGLDETLVFRVVQNKAALPGGFLVAFKSFFSPFYCTTTDIQ